MEEPWPTIWIGNHAKYLMAQDVYRPLLIFRYVDGAPYRFANVGVPTPETPVPS